jgi:glycyl-tRNA synthetase (class II)
VTVDGDTLTAGTVTVRERDSCAQIRIGVAELQTYLGDRLGA